MILLICGLYTSAEAGQFQLVANDSVIGSVQLIPARQNDTLIRIARQHGLGYQEMVQANSATDRWLPTPGSPIVLPTRFVLPRGKRKGVVINLAEMRLYYYPPQHPDQVWTYPIGIGRQGWQTPLASTTIKSRIKGPAWYPPTSILEEYAAKGIELPRKVPPGPDNPLGDFALKLDLPGYLLHGTNRPSGVGMRVSHGCIRLYPEDIEQLFNGIATGTQVRIIDQPFKLGWQGDELYLEAHNPAYPGTIRETTDRFSTPLIYRIQAIAEHNLVDWSAVVRAIQNANGVPTRIGSRHHQTAQSRPIAE